MRNLLAYILLFLWLVLGSWYYTCKVKGYDCSTWRTWMPTAQTDDEEVIDPVKLKDAYGDVFVTEENISIKNSNPYLILGDGYADGLTGISQFLKEHPKTNLRITGLYAEKEINSSSHKNIGVARAEDIKKKLIDIGVGPAQLVVDSAVDNNLFAAGDSIANSDVINFKFSEKYAELNEDDVKEAFRSLEDVSGFMRFSKGSSEVSFGIEGQKSLDKLKYYLNKNKEYVLVVDVPYTSEEIGADSIIGTQRAKSIEAILTQGGIAAQNMESRPKEMVGIFDSENKSIDDIIEFNFRFPDKSADKLKEVQLERGLEQSLTQNTDTANIPDLDQHPEMEFDYGSADLKATQDVIKYAKELAEYLDSNQDKSVHIIGHTDNISSSDFNFRLGNRRAGAARALMMNHSVDTERMKTSSQGENQPIASNDTEEGRQKNRRVEIDIK